MDLEQTDNRDTYIQVALPVPLSRLFDYSVNQSRHASIQIGSRVLVPFANKQLLGIVVSCHQSISVDANKIKEISLLVDDQPLIDKNNMAFAKWLAEFYLYPLGEVFACMLPKLLRTPPKVNNATTISINDFASPSPLSQKVLLALPGNEDALHKLARSKKQWALYQRLLDSNDGSISVDVLKDSYSMAVMSGLISKSLAQYCYKALTKKAWQSSVSVGEKKRANPEQAIAITSINQASGFAPFLLEGVTGSGKTEVYLQVIEQVLARGQQVLVLVPEIGLTPQTVSRFEERFGKVIGVWHSGLTDLERLTIYRQAKHEQVAVVIGTRSSVFLPFANLGMLIVDEEHDESFKQQDSLRYHARDVAAYRAKQLQISLILGSATPSLESLYNGLNKKYRHIQLTQRAGSATMPKMHLADITGVPMHAGIAPSMYKRIEQQLVQGNQVLIFVNRRGYAPALICEQCAHVETCLDCETPFTYHQSAHNLQCHRCGQFHAYREYCVKCGSSNISTQGVGTEQIQAALNKQFPSYSCVRIDSDSTRGKQKLNNLLSEINQNKHQILVGTQILSKGHHFPNVTLALIVNVDAFLFSSDFRAPEKLAQLVTQLSGRAGRAEKPGEVWLQTMHVGHPLLQDLVNNGYGHFSRLLLQERQSANLPPTQWQIALRVEHAEQSIIFNFMQYANQLLAQFKQLTFVGPFPAGIEKKQTRFRFITLAQSQSYSYLNKAIKQVQSELTQHPLAHKVRWSVDVMPIDFS